MLSSGDRSRLDRAQDPVEPVHVEDGVSRPAIAHGHHPGQFLWRNGLAIHAERREQRGAPIKRECIDLVEPATEDQLGRLVEEQRVTARVDEENRDSQSTCTAGRE